MVTTKWDVIFDVLGPSVVKEFARGNLTTREIRSMAAYTEAGGVVRNLIFLNGVDHARTLARKALCRRGMRV